MRSETLGRAETWSSSLVFYRSVVGAAAGLRTLWRVSSAAVPGRHLRMSLAGEMNDLPAFRCRAHISAFLEGWGLWFGQALDAKFDTRATHEPVLRNGSVPLDILGQIVRECIQQGGGRS